MASKSETELSSQVILNRSYDNTTGVLGIEGLGYDGTNNPQRENSKNLATKITVSLSGSITYVAKAKTGTLQSAAAWQVKSIDTTTGVVVTWANGSSSFSNVATDLTILTYS